MIEVINKLLELKQKSFDIEKDKREVASLYEMLVNVHPSRDEYIVECEKFIQKLNVNDVSDSEEKDWLQMTMNHLGASLAVMIFEKKPSITDNEFECMLKYFRDGWIDKEVASCGIYALSQLLNIIHPMTCYQLVKEAFTVNPDLGGILGVEGYKFEGAAAEEHITEACPFCGEKENILPYYCSAQIMKLKNRNVFPPAKLWMKCECCDNYYTYNFPLFNVDYINGHYTSAQREESRLENKFSLKYYSRIFNQIKEYTNGKDYLEIGVGTGEMLAVAMEFGYNVEAVEICKEDCERISKVLNVNIHCSDIVDFEPERKYDVIIMGDVFEHVTAPVNVLKKACAMLNEGGVLWLSTPNYNCGYARLQGFSHAMWHELNHYTYSSYESVCKILDKLGMEVVHYDVSERYMGSMELFIRKTD